MDQAELSRLNEAFADELVRVRALLGSGELCAGAQEKLSGIERHATHAEQEARATYAAALSNAESFRATSEHLANVTAEAARNAYGAALREQREILTAYERWMSEHAER